METVGQEAVGVLHSRDGLVATSLPQDPGGTLTGTVQGAADNGRRG